MINEHDLEDMAEFEQPKASPKEGLTPMKIIKFYAEWCGPCKMLSKTLEDIQKKLEIQEVDIDKDPEIAQRFNVRGVPTMVRVDNGGKEIDRLVGFASFAAVSKFATGA